MPTLAVSTSTENEKTAVSSELNVLDEFHQLLSALSLRYIRPNDTLSKVISTPIEHLQKIEEVANTYRAWFNSWTGYAASTFVHWPLGDYRAHQVAYQQSTEFFTNLRTYLTELKGQPDQLLSESMLKKLQTLFETFPTPKTQLKAYPNIADVTRSHQDLMLLLLALSQHSDGSIVRQENAALTAENTSLQSRVSTLKTENSNIQSQYQRDIAALTAQFRADIATLTAQRQADRAEIDTLNAQRQTDQAQIATLNATLQDLVARVDHMTGQSQFVMPDPNPPVSTNPAAFWATTSIANVGSQSYGNEIKNKIL